MRFMIDVSEVAANIQRTTVPYLVHMGLKPMSDQQCADMAFLAMDDMLNRVMRWCSRTTLFEGAMERMFPWYDTKARDPASKGFMADVVEGAEFEARLIIRPMLPKSTWDVWSLKRFGVHAGLLMNLGDYRKLKMQNEEEQMLAFCSELEQSIKNGDYVPDYLKRIAGIRDF
mgnify:CR=1 FL=1